MSIQRRIYEQNLGVNEAVKVGDTVHIGHGTKGGTGVTGKVTKVSGGMVHIQNDRGDTFKGPVDRVTVKESVELEEGPAHQNPRITAFGGMQAAQNTPSYKRYQEKLKAERESRAKRATQQGLEMKRQKRESVELDELKMPKRDASGRIKSAKVRDALQAGGSRAQKQALKHDASAHANLMRAADTQDQAVANMDKEGMKKADRQIDAANADMARSRRAFGRMKKRHRQAESVEFDEAIKYDSAGDSTGTVTGKGKRDRGPGGQVMVKYKGSETYPKGAKLPIGARDMGRLIKQARKLGTTAYDSRNLRNPRLTKDHVELDGLDLSEMNYLGKDKKFGREFYEKDGQLHVKKPGGTYVQNLGSVSVPSNKKMMKGLVKDSNESFDKLTPAQERDAERRLKPTRATVAKVRLPATDDEVAANVKKWQSEKGGNPGNTKNRRLRDLRLKLKKEEVELDEVSPPGFEGTVKAMKKRHSDKIDNPWALAWWMKNKGYKSHKNADGSDKKEQ